MNIPTVSIENIEEMKVIYVSFQGTYIEFRKQSKKMFRTLFSFAEQHNFIVKDVSKVLTIYHDNPFITEAKNLRTSVAMTIPSGAVIEENDEISVMSISGKFGIGHFEISLGEYEEAWQYMYQKWLLSEKIEPRDAFPFELYVTEPPKSYKGKSFTDIYIPIK